MLFINTNILNRFIMFILTSKEIHYYFSFCTISNSYSSRVLPRPIELQTDSRDCDGRAYGESKPSAHSAAPAAGKHAVHRVNFLEVLARRLLQSAEIDQ